MHVPQRASVWQGGVQQAVQNSLAPKHGGSRCRQGAVHGTGYVNGLPGIERKPVHLHAHHRAQARILCEVQCRLV